MRAIFNRINGRQTLNEIAEVVVSELNWESDQAFQHTRTLFLLLVSQSVAVPKNALELEAGLGAYQGI